MKRFLRHPITEFACFIAVLIALHVEAAWILAP